MEDETTLGITFLLPNITEEDSLVCGLKYISLQTGLGGQQVRPLRLSREDPARLKS